MSSWPIFARVSRHVVLIFKDNITIIAVNSYVILLLMIVLSVPLGLVIADYATENTAHDEPDLITPIAQNEPSLTLEELRQESLANKKIFDRYLIPYTMSPAQVEHFGGVEQAIYYHKHLDDLLEESKGNKWMESVNGRTMLSLNFFTLTGTTEPMEKIAALVLQERIRDGTYQQPDLEPLQILHEYLLAEHHTTDDPTKVLVEMLGDMYVLAPEVLDITEMNTLFGNFPSTEVVFADFDYWLSIRWYGNCVFIEEGNDCDVHLEAAKNLSVRQNKNSTESSNVTLTETLPTMSDGIHP